MRVLPFVAALALPLGASAQVNSNDATFNNNGDVMFIYSSPSSGFDSLASPPDITGDLYWRAHSGAQFMNDVEPSLAGVPADPTGAGSVMEIDGYFESLYDTDWSTTPSFYTRSHGPAQPDSAGLGGLEPAFFGPAGLTTEVIVTVGPSGFGNPCTVNPSLCSPSGGNCPPPGFVNGYLVDLAYGSTPGTGIVLPADGTSASDTATTWFVHGGMTAMGGACGMGDYDIQDVHSTDETQADITGTGINPSGGFQMAGSGPTQEGVASMAEANETWRGNIIQFVTDTGTGLGAEEAYNGGGAMNGRNLSVGSGAATLSCELRDYAGTTFPSISYCGASLTPLANPGFAVQPTGNLLVLPDGLFGGTATVWQGFLGTTSFGFTAEGAISWIPISVPTTSAGADLHGQCGTYNLTTFAFETSNQTSLSLTL
ncbi:MAG: hypothetical protein AAF682_25730 [Planctomycetota bacterium]